MVGGSDGTSVWCDVAWWSVVCRCVEWCGGLYSCSAVWCGVEFCPGMKISSVKWQSLVRSASYGRGIERDRERERERDMCWEEREKVNKIRI